jgi:hypothetical protein
MATAGFAAGPVFPAIAVIKEARRLEPDLFTLIITGRSRRFPIAELMANGTADIMFKPFH